MSTINPTMAMLQRLLASRTQPQNTAAVVAPVTAPASVDAAGATAAAVADAAAATEALANETNTAATSAVTDTAATTPANSIAVYESALAGYPVFNLTVPDISYTPPTMEELLLEAQQLYSGGYNRQTQAAQKAYADALADLQRTYAQNRENVQNAATARGFGRSNYVTDALAQLGDREALAQQRNAEQLLQQLSNLGLDYENQMSAYASQQYRAGQQQAYENELLKAQLQMELDKLGYQSAVNRFLYEQEHPNLYADPNAVAGVSSGGGGGVSGYNPYWESVDTSVFNGGSSSGSSRSSSSRSSNNNNNNNNNNYKNNDPNNPFVVDNSLSGATGYGQTMLMNQQATDIIRDYGAQFYNALLSDVQGADNAAKTTQAILNGMASSPTGNYNKSMVDRTPVTSENSWNKTRAANATK